MTIIMGYKIELKNISFGYDRESEIISGMNLSVLPGEVLGVVAPVGGGKSTLLKLCAGLVRPSGGELLINKRSFWSLSNKENYEIRRVMGFDFQESALIVNMTIFQNLALPLKYHALMSDNDIVKIVDDWLGRFELKKYRDSLPAILSAGLRRKVSFIRAMLLGREFFFWDESSEGADETFESVLVDTIIAKKKMGAGSIVVTQRADFLARTADKVLVMSGGKSRYLGPLEGGKIPVAVDAKGMLRG